MVRYAFLTAAALATFAVPVTAFAEHHAGKDGAPHVAPYAPLTLAEVEAAQKAWGDALVAISTEYDTKGIAAATKLAGDVLDSAYAYNMGPVLFKPTLTVAPQTFRTTREGALAYFVGGNPAYKSDKGFALNSWRSVRIENAGVVITGDTAISMGNVMITNAKGEVTTVDKTWAYVRDGEGKLRIVLHHSSLPHKAN
jgi:hypothetical protein